MQRMHLAWFALLAVLAAGLVGTPAAQAVVQPGFVRSGTLATVGGVTVMAFTPDATQLFVGAKSGTVALFEVGPDASLNLSDAAVLDISARVCADVERGLLGLAVAPDYATTRNVYVYYTFDRGVTGPNRCQAVNSGAVTANNPVNRVSRFTLVNGKLGDERVLVDNMPSVAGNHNAGDIQFGADGYLYIAIGDGGCDYAGDSGCGGSNDAARDANVLTGKILRIIPNPDLAAADRIPATNPYRSTGSICALDGHGPPATPISTPCQETFASGLRNPFRMAFDPATTATTRFLINDVGQGVWEEIDLGEAGADYRWNICEGSHVNGTRTPCAAPTGNQRNPIHEYDHNGNDGGGTDTSGCHSITDGALVPSAGWPPSMAGRYIFGDFICGKLFTIDVSGAPPYQRTLFADNVGGVVDMTFGPGPDGPALYVADINTGAISRFTAQSVPLYTVDLPLIVK